MIYPMIMKITTPIATKGNPPSHRIDFEIASPNDMVLVVRVPAGEIYA